MKKDVYKRQQELYVARSISDPYWAHEYKKFQPELAEIAELRQLDRKSTRLNSSHITRYRMPSSA